MNSRPIVLVFLLLVLFIASQFEWKQQIGDNEANPEAKKRRQQAVERKDVVQKKIILAQEKNIQQLSELIQSLQVHLLLCRASNSTAHTMPSHSASGNEAVGLEVIDD